MFFKKKDNPDAFFILDDKDFNFLNEVFIIIIYKNCMSFLNIENELINKTDNFISAEPGIYYAFMR